MLDGRLIVAAPGLTDPNFVGAIVLVVSHDEHGALGLILNRPTEEPVDGYVPDWLPRIAAPAVVFVGGPVEPEVGMALGHGSRQPCLGDIGLVQLDTDDVHGDGRVRVFSGYAGWGPGQLEAEVESGGWGVVEASEGDPFHPRPQRLWRDVLRRQRGELALWVTLPVDPELN